MALLKRVNGQFICLFLLQKMVRKCEVCCSGNCFKPPMFFIDRTKAVIQHFWRRPLSNWRLKKKKKHWKNTKNSYFLISVASLYTPCFVKFCVFLYGPFCHGAHKLDLSTLFTTFFLWTSLSFIIFFYKALYLCFTHNDKSIYHI